MKRIAIIGGGIAGLSAAHALRGRAEVHLFERAPRLGGHANAVALEGQLVETGFLAFHRSRYPRMAALLDELGLETAPTDVSLTVRAEGVCFRQEDWLATLPRELGAALAGLMAQILRHEKKPVVNVSLRDLAAAYPPEVTTLFLVPTIAALWGFQPEDILEMSVVSVFESLGRFIGPTSREPFLRIAPASATWVERLAGDTRVHLGARVTAVAPGRIQVDGTELPFDRVVLATHADQALALLSEPTPAQQAALAPITYRRTSAFLHQDPGLLLAPPAAYSVDLLRGHVTWDMTRLMGLPIPAYVTVGPPSLELPAAYRTSYTHPAMTPAAIAAIPLLQALQDPAITFCGSYFGTTGSHEAAVASGQAAAALALQ